jgi:DNA-binding transcriptional LysR family regulator
VVRTNVTLRHLRSLISVAETGSFTRAAARLFVTQSTLTSTIQQLESSVGVKLFDRTTRTVTTTPAAMRFCEQAERLLRDFDTMIGDLHALSESAQGSLRIATAPSVLSWLLAPALNGFRAAYPNVTLSLRDAGSQDIERRVLEGEVDFGIASAQSGHSELNYSPLFKDRYGVVCSPDHPLAGLQGPLHWSQVAAFQSTMVGLASDTNVGSLHRATMHRFDLADCPEEVSSSTSLYALLALGNRFSILPVLTAQTHQLETLVFRDLIEPVVHRNVYLITRKLRSLSPSAQRLQEALLATLDQLTLPKGLERVPPTEPTP